MDLVTCSECGNDVSETTATAPPKQARKTHPIYVGCLSRQ